MKNQAQRQLEDWRVENEKEHIHLLKISDKEVPKHLYQLTEKNLFEALIYPLSSAQFFEQDYA